MITIDVNMSLNSGFCAVSSSTAKMWFIDQPMFEKLKSPKYCPGAAKLKTIDGEMTIAIPLPPILGTCATMASTKFVEKESD